MPELNSNDKA